MAGGQGGHDVIDYAHKGDVGARQRPRNPCSAVALVHGKFL